MLFPAHIRCGANGPVIQTATQHSHHTASIAAAHLSGVGLEKTGYLLGLIHDCGKFKQEFAQYLSDPNGIRGSVNHTLPDAGFCWNGTTIRKVTPFVA